MSTVPSRIFGPLGSLVCVLVVLFFVYDIRKGLAHRGKVERLSDGGPTTRDRSGLGTGD